MRRADNFTTFTCRLSGNFVSFSLIPKGLNIEIGNHDRGQAAFTRSLCLTETLLIVRCKMSHASHCHIVATTGLFGERAYSVCQMFGHCERVPTTRVPDVPNNTTCSHTQVDSVLANRGNETSLEFVIIRYRQYEYAFGGTFAKLRKSGC